MTTTRAAVLESCWGESSAAVPAPGHRRGGRAVRAVRSDRQRRLRNGVARLGSGPRSVPRREAPAPQGRRTSYWERANGFTQTFDNIIANENTEGRAIVDIAPGDARFTSSGCGTWTRVG